MRRPSACRWRPGPGRLARFVRAGEVGKEFGYHGTVNHSANEDVRLGSYIHVNTAESFFSIVKRGITGMYHSVSEAHLHRYLAEFDFRYNTAPSSGARMRNEPNARLRVWLASGHIEQQAHA